MDYARKALLAWVSIPDDGKDLKGWEGKFTACFPELHEEFPELVDADGYGWYIRHICSISALAQQNPKKVKASVKEYLVEKLPDTYNTPLMRIFEPNGIELSIGQWQKLAVARAFYADSEILILDEPTASLDPIAEQEIFNQFDTLRSFKTTIFVSHRLSSATIADQIIVLENGCLIEKGSHLSLMERKGKYYELFSTQAKRYITQGKDIPHTGSSGRPCHSV